MFTYNDIVETARKICENSKIATVDLEGIKLFSKSITTDDILKKISISGTENGPPLYNFSDDRVEINFWFLYGYMQFGHGFRLELHKEIGMGASKTLTKGIDEMMKDGYKLTAEELKNMKRKEILKYFGVPEKGVLKDLNDQFILSLNSCGSELLSNGYKDFTELVRKTYKENRNSIHLLRKISGFFSCLKDVPKTEDGKDMYILKKAILIISFLSNLKEFWFSDIGEITGIIDNVVPRVMLAEEKEEMEYRVASFYATRLLSKELGKGIRDDQLSHYFWLKGKEPSLRKLERHYNKKTVFY